MFNIRIHSASRQQVRWPKRSADLLALGQTVLAAEQGLPANQQYPQLAVLQTRLDALHTVLTTAHKAEATRTAQAGAEKTALETARTLSRRLILVLMGKYVDVTLLEAWGVEVVATGGRPHTRVPVTREAMLLMLSRYLAQETSLPAEQRVATPTLAEVTAAHDALATAKSQRLEALATRGLAIHQRGEAAQTLLLTLKHLAFYHITFHFGGMVDQNLQTLGFDLIARAPVRLPENGGSPAP